MSYNPSPYKFTKVCTNSIDSIHLRTHVYRFTSEKSNLTYLVDVEHYIHNVFVLKFYLRDQKKWKVKFNLLTNTNEARLIIFTCIDIMIDVFKQNTNASFGFQGARTFSLKTKEYTEHSQTNTKRFNIYRKIVANALSEDYFEHYSYEKESIYLLLNKSNKCTTSYRKQIESTFRYLYPSLNIPD